MELPSYFKDFLQDIRLTSNQIDECKTRHRTLTQRLNEDEQLARIIVSTFLQGSYRRATAVRPYEGKRADVDVIVVTRLSEQEHTPSEALRLFVPFLDKHYQDKYEIQGRSIGIAMSYVDLDLVVTSAPSESEIGILESDSVTTEDTLEDTKDWRLVKSWVPLEERAAWNAPFLLRAAEKEAEWKLSPLRIPDREAQCWESTHPLEQIRWTRDKNQQCNLHYISVVKAIKWWRRVKHPTPKYPKGYPVEHLVGECCPDGVTSVAAGITLTLEKIANAYQWYALNKQTPFMPDRGVPEHNVFGRVAGEDFAAFHVQVCEAAKIARRALDAEDVCESAKAWGELFGDRFPKPPSGKSGDRGSDGGSVTGGYTPRRERTEIGEGRFA
jgi:hypothetical protein